MFKNASIRVQCLVMIVAISCCVLTFTILFRVLIFLKAGIPPGAIGNVQQSMMEDHNLVRGLHFLSALCLFLFPAIICARLFSDNYKAYLGINRPVYTSIVFWTIAGIVVACPFLNLTYYFNQQMVFPEALKGLETWMRASEEVAEKGLELLLKTHHIPTILFNFLIICVMAAVTEEFMFRGLLQKFFGRVIRNPHVLIWIIAVLFSAIHFQFYGFITRMLLGAWFGYLMYYTKTIWIPVLAHLTNNAIRVGLYYVFQDTPDEVKKIDALGTGSTWWLAVVSLALFTFCFHQIIKAVNR